MSSNPALLSPISCRRGLERRCGAREATQAWVELEYNARVNDDTGEAPLKRFFAMTERVAPGPGQRRAN
jgi:hypothetical protein